MGPRSFLVRATVGWSVLLLGGPVSARPLLVYAGAGFRAPVEDAARAFAEGEGIAVEATFAGSGCLLAQAELAGRGDVLIPGELHYVEKACARGLAGDPVFIAYLRPVIAVRTGNPLGIRGPADLARPGVRVGLGDPASVAVGVAAERWLASVLSEGTWERIRANVTSRALNVNELGSQLTLHALDAAVVWDATVPLFPDLEALDPVSPPEFRTTITGSVLRMSSRPGTARRFLDFLAGEEGGRIFRAHGYEPFRPVEPVVAAGTGGAP